MRDKDDYGLARIYESSIFNNQDENEVVEEWFAPSQRSLGKWTQNKIGGFFGTKASMASNKLSKLYTKVWDEYQNTRKSNKGVGGSGEHNLKDAVRTLQNMGVSDSIITSVLRADSQYKNYAKNPEQPTDRDVIGNFLYSVLQKKYQNSGAYTPKKQLPQTL
jgi:hypothetical protein